MPDQQPWWQLQTTSERCRAEGLAMTGYRLCARPCIKGHNVCFQQKATTGTHRVFPMMLMDVGQELSRTLIPGRKQIPSQQGSSWLSSGTKFIKHIFMEGILCSWHYSRPKSFYGKWGPIVQGVSIPGEKWERSLTLGASAGVKSQVQRKNSVISKNQAVSKTKGGGIQMSGWFQFLKEKVQTQETTK